jgi:hypothetical protein
MKVYLSGWIYRNKNTGHTAIYRGPASNIHGTGNVVLEDLEDLTDGNIRFVLIPWQEFRDGWEEYND